MNEQTKPVAILLRTILPHPLLAGAAAGREAFALVRPAAESAGAHSLLCLDLAGMNVVTGSALRELLLPLDELSRKQNSVLVIGNLDDAALDEIRLVAEATRCPFICATLVNEQLQRPIIYGPLDEKLALTLQLVLEAGEADAKTVHERSGESTLVTVWNNRLVALENLGLLSKRKVGKTKYYAPILEGILYGH